MGAGHEIIQVVGSVAVYLERRGHKLWPCGDSHRGACPFCGGTEYSSKFVATEAIYHCWACGESGSLVTLAQKLQKVPYAQAIKILLKQLNIDENEVDSFALVEEHRENKRKKLLASQQEHDAVAEKARELWEKLPNVKEPGQIYCKSRGIITPKDYIRFSNHSVCVALYNIEGEIVNIVGRSWRNSDRIKVRGLTGGSVEGYFSAEPIRFEAEDNSSLILSEGVFDTLTTIQAEKSKPVAGAHGVHNIQTLAHLASYSTFTKIDIMCQNDPAGRNACYQAGNIFDRAGKAFEIHLPPEGYVDFNEVICAREGLHDK